MVRNRLAALSLAALLALPFAGCSEGRSPTEPMFDLDAASSTSSVSEEARGRGRGRGGNDGRADDNNNNRNNRRGRGNRDDDRNNRPQGGQEFEGAVASVNGATLTLAGGARVVVNAQTQWSARGDLMSLSEIAGSLQAGDNPRVEGRGTRQGDGAILAQTIKAEDER